MNLEQHLTAGEKLKEFREFLQGPEFFFGGFKTRPEPRAVRRVLKSLDHLRMVLDIAICRDLPNCPGVRDCYYGMSAAWRARQAAKNGRTTATPD